MSRIPTPWDHNPYPDIGTQVTYVLREVEVSQYHLERTSATVVAINNVVSVDLYVPALDATRPSITITDATDASPIVITTQGAHGFNNGQQVEIQNVGGNTAANGNFVIALITAASFSLKGSTGNGAYTSGGTAQRGGPTLTAVSYDANGAPGTWH